MRSHGLRHYSPPTSHAQPPQLLSHSNPPNQSQPTHHTSTITFPPPTPTQHTSSPPPHPTNASQTRATASMQVHPPLITAPFHLHANSAHQIDCIDLCMIRPVLSSMKLTMNIDSGKTPHIYNIQWSVVRKV